MDSNEKHLQSAGICHRLLYFIMKILAAQAFKPVILGPPVPSKQTLNPSRPLIGQLPQSIKSHGSTDRAEDSDTSVLIDIEDATSLVHEDREKGSVVGANKTKAPKKTVSINDEPEIICLSNKRRKVMAERHMLMMEGGIGREMRPLKSILKVGSKFRGDIS